MAFFVFGKYEGTDDGFAEGEIDSTLLPRRLAECNFDPVAELEFELNSALVVGNVVSRVLFDWAFGDTTELPGWMIVAFWDEGEEILVLKLVIDAADSLDVCLIPDKLLSLSKMLDPVNDAFKVLLWWLVWEDTTNDELNKGFCGTLVEFTGELEDTSVARTVLAFSLGTGTGIWIDGIDACDERPVELFLIGDRELLASLLKAEIDELSVFVTLPDAKVLVLSLVTGKGMCSDDIDVCNETAVELLSFVGNAELPLLVLLLKAPGVFTSFVFVALPEDEWVVEGPPIFEIEAYLFQDRDDTTLCVLFGLDEVSVTLLSVSGLLKNVLLGDVELPGVEDRIFELEEPILDFLEIKDKLGMLEAAFRVATVLDFEFTAFPEASVDEVFGAETLSAESPFIELVKAA